MRRLFVKFLVTAFLVSSVSFGIVACQSAPQSNPSKSTLWITSTKTDEFTDVVTRMVTVRESAIDAMSFRGGLKLYPFVGIVDGENYVGIRSGGIYGKIPTGTVQIRIDDNAAWTITPEETPVSLMPSAPSMNKDVSENMMGNMAKIMSPYTVATGDKANEIIQQMLAGKVIKYRTVGLNQAASSTGEVKIDSSFGEAIRSIGITVGKP